MPRRKREKEKDKKRDENAQIRERIPKFCRFCKGRKEPSLKEWETLGGLISDRGRIIPRARSGVCAKHQRRLSREIERARHLALFPFLVRPE